jgi:tetratricopeptide (TPR) repeat protein
VAFWKADAPRLHRASYAGALLLFVGGLLSKITVAVLPPVLLVLAWWKRGRLRWREDMLPALPFLALAVAYGPLAMSLEDKQLAVGGADWDLTWPQRVLIAGRVLWFYPGKLLWPEGLAFIYPRWVPDAGSPAQWLFPLAALGVLLGAWLARQRIGRGPAAALFCYAGALFPVLGFMDVFYMRYSFVADHWVYLPSLGLFALVAAGLARVATASAAILLPVLAFLTWQQAHQYRDAETLWRTTIARNPEAWLAHHDLGVLLLDRPPLDESMALFRRTIALRPGYAEAHYNLGTALLRSGRRAEAVASFEQALRLRPAHAEAHNNLGYTLVLSGNPDAAIQHYRRALELRPDYADAHANLGNALQAAGAWREARVHFESALQGNPRLWPALNGLAMLLATAPESADRDAPRALLLAEKARGLTAGRDPAVLHTQAAAQAALGRFGEAVATAEAALELATAQGQRPLAEILRQSLPLYRQGQPLR